MDRANAEAILGALVALGGTRGGTRHNVVTFAPPIAGGTCTPLAAVQVPTRGRAIVQARARTVGLGSDADRLTLRCAGS